MRTHRIPTILAIVAVTACGGTIDTRGDGTADGATDTSPDVAVDTAPDGAPDTPGDGLPDLVEEPLPECGDERGPTPETFPVVNGSPTWDSTVVDLTDGQALAVGALMQRSSGSWSSFCTATLVTPTLVLTAASALKATDVRDRGPLNAHAPSWLTLGASARFRAEGLQGVGRLEGQHHSDEDGRDEYDGKGLHPEEIHLIPDEALLDGSGKEYPPRLLGEDGDFPQILHAVPELPFAPVHGPYPHWEHIRFSLFGQAFSPSVSPRSTHRERRFPRR